MSFDWGLTTSNANEKLRTVCEFGILLTYLLKFETKTPKKKKIVLFLKNDNSMVEFGSTFARFLESFGLILPFSILISIIGTI